jgi:hypothetical protein
MLGDSVSKFCYIAAAPCQLLVGLLHCAAELATQLDMLLLMGSSIFLQGTHHK